jgi:hypothetical protein
MDFLLALLSLVVAALNLVTALVTIHCPVAPQPPQQETNLDDGRAGG